MPAWDLYGAKTNGFLVVLLLYTLLVLDRIVIGNCKGISKRGVKANRVQRRKLVPFLLSDTNKKKWNFVSVFGFYPSFSFLSPHFYPVLIPD